MDFRHRRGMGEGHRSRQLTTHGPWNLLLDQQPASPSSDPLGSGADSLSDGPEAAGSTRFELFAQLRRRLADAAAETGLLVVLDDLQRADEASTAVLVDLAGQLRGTRPLVVATYRDPPLSRRELEVASLVRKGFTNKQIAKSLFVSERTPRTMCSTSSPSSASPTGCRSPPGQATSGRPRSGHERRGRIEYPR